MQRETASLTGVILAAGEGRRMGPLGARFPKACLPLCNAPLIRHHFEILRTMGITDVVVVVGFRREEVIAAAAHSAPPEMRLRFVDQPERRGIAHALWLARREVRERFVVVLGDTYFVPQDLHEAWQLMETDRSQKLAAVLSIRSEPNPELIRKECSVRFDERRRLIEIREKPAQPFNDQKPCGIYFFDRRIFEAIDRTPPSPLRGEVEITDAIQTLVTTGYEVGRASTVRWDCNVNFPGDLLSSNLVELRRRELLALVGERAVVHPDAVVEQSIIGERAHVTAPVRLLRSLVLDDVRLEAVDSYEEAIVGRDFVLQRCLSGIGAAGLGQLDVA